MAVLATYLVAVAAPAVIFGGVAVVMRWFTTAPGTPVHDVPQPASGRDLKRLVADLGRLEREYVKIERSDPPAKAARLRAVSLAYDDTLRDCCRVLGLPPPAERPLSGLARLQTEAELAQRGLVW